MYPLVFEHMNPMRGVELKNLLINDGLVHHYDFEWEYHAPMYDNDGYSAVTPRRVSFHFRDEALATWYKLKWS